TGSESKRASNLGSQTVTSGGPERSLRAKLADREFSGSIARAGASPVAALFWRLTLTTTDGLSAAMRLMNVVRARVAARSRELVPGISAITVLFSTRLGVSVSRLLVSAASSL